MVLENPDLDEGSQSRILEEASAVNLKKQKSSFVNTKVISVRVQALHSSVHDPLCICEIIVIGNQIPWTIKLIGLFLQRIQETDHRIRKG